MSSHSDPGAVSAPLPADLQSRNPLRWLTIFGPGAIIASLTIGVGELVFSARAGALFGYRLLWVFALVLLLKWVLVFASARHMVLTGAHPFERWMRLPGPPGWFPLAFFLLAVACFPIWVCFHAGTLGTLLAWLTGTGQMLRGAAHYAWGMGVLLAVLGLSWAGGYRALERIQLAITLLMLGSVMAALFFIHPDWLACLKGLLVPQALDYPAWIHSADYAEIAARPVWVETVTYVGVIGGSSYDYLAYVSYLRDKHWGRAGRSIATTAELAVTSAAPAHVDRRWLRAPLVDCTLSFLAVLVFSGVFVVCGAEVLGPQHKVPAGSNLLSLQAEFVSAVHPALKSLYFVGAFLAVFGTLYGTIEVAPAVLREMLRAANPARAERLQRTLRYWAVGWVGALSLGILAWSCLFRVLGGGKEPPGLIAILTPANLFTGVLGCGFVCLLNGWMDRRFLPDGLRMPWALKLWNAMAGVLFLALGLKSYWDHSRWRALAILAGTLAAGWMVAWAARSRKPPPPTTR